MDDIQETLLSMVSEQLADIQTNRNKKQDNKRTQNRISNISIVNISFDHDDITVIPEPIS